jgi:hypothetical protein
MNGRGWFVVGALVGAVLALAAALGVVCVWVGKDDGALERAVGSGE